jgi:hypothetical protein
MKKVQFNNKIEIKEYELSDDEIIEKKFAFLHIKQKIDINVKEYKFEKSLEEQKKLYTEKIFKQLYNCFKRIYNLN